MSERVNTMRRARIKFSFNGLGLGPTMAPTFVNTSMPTQNVSISTDDNRRLQSSELKLYEEETNENRQLQTNSSRLEICLRKYSKIVQVTEQITVPVPYNITPSDYRLTLESLLSDSDYIQSINERANYYNLSIYYNVSTEVCGYVTLQSEPSQLPTLEPSTVPSTLPTSLPSIIPSIAPAVAPTFLPSSFPTVNPTDKPTALPSLNPSISPTEQPSTVPSIAPALPPTFTPSEVPSTFPSLVPSFLSSLVPSINPSELPSAAPTLIPSLAPTNVTYMLSINFTQVKTIFLDLYCHHILFFSHYFYDLCLVLSWS